MATASDTYGLLAEFPDPAALTEAAQAAHSAGYRRMDAYTPIPVEGLSQALGMTHTRLPAAIFSCDNAPPKLRGKFSIATAITSSPRSSASP